MRQRILPGLLAAPLSEMRQGREGIRRFRELKPFELVYCLADCRSPISQASFTASVKTTCFRSPPNTAGRWRPARRDDRTVAAVEVAERGRSEINVAIIGRPNVGKSSLINKLLGEKRVIVSHIPGTTRDAVDSLFESQVGEDDETVRLRLIDADGIRRKGKTTGMEEKLSAHPACLPHSSRDRQSLYFS